MKGDEDLGLTINMGGEKFHALAQGPGMHGDEDLGLTINMGGEKFHALAQQGLPKCDGSNGVVGLDCVSVLNYPRKTDGRPWGPMNDAYPEGYPRYASRV